MSWNPGWNGPVSSGGSVGNDYGLAARRPAPDLTKTPDEAVRVDFPWAARLNGETVSSVSYELPDGLSNDAESGTTSLRSVLVSGGNDGSLYRVIATCVTSGGRTLQQTKRVLVLEG